MRHSSRASDVALSLSRPASFAPNLGVREAAKKKPPSPGRGARAGEGGQERVVRVRAGSLGGEANGYNLGRDEIAGLHEGAVLVGFLRALRNVARNSLGGGPLEGGVSDLLPS